MEKGGGLNDGHKVWKRTEIKNLVEEKEVYQNQRIILITKRETVGEI